MHRHDMIDLAGLDALAPTHLVISPGPKHPRRGGHLRRRIRHFAGRVPVLGVCLGHQAIGQAFGGKDRPRRRSRFTGRPARSPTTGKTLFAGIENPMTATRYHSLIVEATCRRSSRCRPVRR